MHRSRQTQSRRAWRPPGTASPAAGGRFGMVAPGRYAGRRAPAGRRGQSSGGSPMVVGRGLLGAFAKQTPAKRSRKGPVLVAVVAGLGAAGAAALKRRRSAEDQPPVDIAQPPSAPMPGPPALDEAAPPPA